MISLWLGCFQSSEGKLREVGYKGKWRGGTMQEVLGAGGRSEREERGKGEIDRKDGLNGGSGGVFPFVLWQLTIFIVVELPINLKCVRNVSSFLPFWRVMFLHHLLWLLALIYSLRDSACACEWVCGCVYMRVSGCVAV